MKTITIAILLVFCSPSNGQSVLTLEGGTTLGIFSGADLCAGSITGSGIIYGGGTICGGLVAVESPAANEIPQSYLLQQNYPNPFNPVTTVRYQLPAESFVSIKLYDQLGRETGTLFEGSQQPAYYTITIDGGNMASGIYYCVLRTEEYFKTIKINLIK